MDDDDGNGGLPRISVVPIRVISVIRGLMNRSRCCGLALSNIRVARRPIKRQNTMTWTTDDADERGYDGMDDDDGNGGLPRISVVAHPRNQCNPRFNKLEPLPRTCP